jgi:hypothetical protein
MYSTSGMDPRAEKRFNNDRTKAAQSALMGQSAKSSVPSPSVRRASPKVLNQQSAPVSNTTPMGGGELPAPPMGAMPEFSVEETITNNMDLEKILSSPELQESIARSRLRKYFKRNDPSGVVTDVAMDALSNMLQKY